MSTVAGDQVHWYDKDGSPVWSITGKNGKERSPYAKEAIERGYVPGVTAICRQAWSYGLQNYFVEQGIWAALTLPRINGEADADFVERIKEDSKTHARQRSDEGSELHKAIDLFVLGEDDWDHKWDKHIQALQQVMFLYGYDLTKGKPQVTFATPRYGGTADLVFPDAIWDWKTKEKLDGKKKLAYDDHCMQLVAYGLGIEPSKPKRKFNVFVGCEDAMVQVHEWNDDKELNRCALKFRFLCDYWWADKT